MDKQKIKEMGDRGIVEEAPKIKKNAIKGVVGIVG